MVRAAAGLGLLALLIGTGGEARAHDAWGAPENLFEGRGQSGSEGGGRRGV